MPSPRTRKARAHHLVNRIGIDNAGNLVLPPEVAHRREVDGTDHLQVGEEAPDYLRIDERLYAPRQDELINRRGRLIGKRVVFTRKESRAFVLVVNDDGSAMLVDVHAIDAAHKVHARIGDMVRSGAAATEAQLEVARRKALELVQFIVD